ncbi:hypothetical protein ACLQ3C_19990 [Gordonia sp. DT30]|uniref:hypothetical protein n=1 Tax=Gordonia sp. DT30 TaxID=3416546 RepID=UPI003CFAEC48
MSRVLTTYSGVSPEAEANLRWGISHRMWGLRKEPGNCRVDDRFAWHVIGARAKGLRHGPRSQPDEWVTGTIDVFVFRVESPLRYGTDPLWPDEVAEREVNYPYRFSSELVARAFKVTTRYDDPIPQAVSEGIRRAASRAESVQTVSLAEFDVFRERIESWD